MQVLLLQVMAGYPYIEMWSKCLVIKPFDKDCISCPCNVPHKGVLTMALRALVEIR